MTCQSCHSELIRVSFSRAYYLVCNNVQCHFYRERQVTHRPRTLYPGYPAENERRRANYRYARERGLDDRQASKLRGCSRETVERAVDKEAGVSYTE